MKTIYMVRHGQTDGNLGKAYLGAKDPLTEHGREQARKVAERCAKLPLDVIISSSMDRARDTAAKISEVTGVSFEISDNFVEAMEPSSIIGLERADPRHQEIFHAWRNTFFKEGRKEGDGENFSEMAARADRALAELEARAESNILVVSHGFFARMFLGKVLFGSGLTADEYRKIVERVPRTENTHISVFHYDENDPVAKWQMWVWNDHAHLG